jgi:PAS domain S-box-containing protein
MRIGGGGRVHEPKEQIWALINRGIGVGALLIDCAANVSWANDDACTMFGADAGALDGTAYATLFTEEDRALGALETELAIARSRGFSEDDRWHRRLDGSRFWASGILSILQSDNGEVVGFAKLVRNRTEVKEQLVTMRSEILACREQMRARAADSAEAAHEIRNALSGMSALIGALRQGRLTAEGAMQLADISERQLNIARRLTEDLMNAAATQYGAPTLKIERCVLQPILEETVQLVGDSIGRRHLALLTPPAEIACNVDRERLLQVLGNLLRNAIKFTAEGGHVWLKLTVEGSMAVIRVEDDGIGIEADMLDRIFDAFTQANSNIRPADARGIGMGLAIARETVRMMRGSIQAMSDGVGKGATFTVRFPMSPA